MDADQLRRALSRYVPHEAVDDCLEWITSHRIAVRVTRSRTTKYGDYTSPHNGKGHRISINHDLGPFAFLITFTHEVAHLITYTKYQRNVSAHGLEWQFEFKQLMVPFLRRNIFPEDLSAALALHMAKPSASSCTDLRLQRVLRRYDNKTAETPVLEEIPENARFRISSGREFIKGKLIRKNYSCVDVKNKHTYFINPLTEVIICETEPADNLLFPNGVDPSI